MLEGLEIREFRIDDVLNNKDFRIDSAFYTKAPIKNESLKYIKIGDVLLSSQYGVSIAMNEDGVGYPIYRMNEIHNMLCDNSVNKCAELSIDEFNKFKLYNRDVLFNRTNSFEWVGRTGVYFQNDNIAKVFASYLVRFCPDERIITPEYLSAFLNSKYGVWDVKRRARQSINQTNVNPEEVKEIEIPILAPAIQKTITEYFIKANDMLWQSEQKYVDAENILLDELSLNDWQPTNEAATQKSFADFLESGRLDAEYYQPKYDEIESKIKSYKSGCGKLNDFISEYSTGFPFVSDSYVAKGFPLIRITNIKKGELDMSNVAYIPVGDEELSKKDIVNGNDLLVSMSGTIGNCCKIPKGLYAIINQRILRFSVKDFNPDVLCLLINSVIGKMQLERVGTGGVQTNISLSDIQNILIPKLNFELQNQIAQKIQESFALRAESKRLLELAKTAVEVAIEQGEEKGLELLNE